MRKQSKDICKDALDMLKHALAMFYNRFICIIGRLICTNGRPYAQEFVVSYVFAQVFKQSLDVYAFGICKQSLDTNPPTFDGL